MGRIAATESRPRDGQAETVVKGEGRGQAGRSARRYIALDVDVRAMLNQIFDRACVPIPGSMDCGRLAVLRDAGEWQGKGG